MLYSPMGATLPPSSFPTSFPPSSMLRCPVSRSDIPPPSLPPPQPASGLSLAPSPESTRDSGQPIVPHHVASEGQQQELILQTPLGSFHRCPSSYQGLLSHAVKSEGPDAGPRRELSPGSGLLSVDPRATNHFPGGPGVESVRHRDQEVCPVPPRLDDLKQDARVMTTAARDGGNNTAAKDKVAACSSPEDFIDVDLNTPSKTASHKADIHFITTKNSAHVNKTDMRRMMTDPMVPEMIRKRLLESMDCDIDPKVD